MNDPIHHDAQLALKDAGVAIRRLPFSLLFRTGALLIHRRAADLRLALAAYDGAPRALRRKLAPAIRQAVRSLRRTLAQ